MKTPDEQKAAQSDEDRKVAGIKKCENGYTLRVDSKTWIFPDLDKLFEKIRWHFDNKQ